MLTFALRFTRCRSGVSLRCCYEVGDFSDLARLPVVSYNASRRTTGAFYAPPPPSEGRPPSPQKRSLMLYFSAVPRTPYKAQTNALAHHIAPLSLASCACRRHRGAFLFLCLLLSFFSHLCFLSLVEPQLPAEQAPQASPPSTAATTAAPSVVSRRRRYRRRRRRCRGRTGGAARRHAAAVGQLVLNGGATAVAAAFGSGADGGSRAAGLEKALILIERKK